MGVKYSTPSKLSREFHTEKIIGHGAFGVVLQSTHEFDNIAYAIKIIKLPGVKDKESDNKILREAKIYAMIPSHQNIVSYKNSWLDNINTNELTQLMELRKKFPDAKALEFTPPVRILVIQMELCERNLRQYLWSIQEDPDNDAQMETQSGHGMDLNVAKHLKIFEQITLGLRHIHKYGLIHRDLKPENIFFCKEDRTVVKIGDMGIAKVAEPIPNDMTKIGTWHYMPPEQFQPTYGKEVDLYALGLILVELFIPQSEFQFLSTLIEILRRQLIPNEFDEKYPQLAQLARKLTASKPEDRPPYHIILKTVQNYAAKVFKPPSGTDTNHGVGCSTCYKIIKGIRHRCSTCPDTDCCDTCWKKQPESTVCRKESHTFFDIIACNKCKKDLNTGRVFAYYVCHQENAKDTPICYCPECFVSNLVDHSKTQNTVDKVVVDEFGQELDRYSVKENYNTIVRRRSGRHNQADLNEQLLNIAIQAENNASNAYSTRSTLLPGTSKSGNSNFFTR